MLFRAAPAQLINSCCSPHLPANCKASGRPLNSRPVYLKMLQVRHKSIDYYYGGATLISEDTKAIKGLTPPNERGLFLCLVIYMARLFEDTLAINNLLKA